MAYDANINRDFSPQRFVTVRYAHLHYALGRKEKQRQQPEKKYQIYFRT